MLTLLERGVARLEELGVVVVAAAGNEGSKEKRRKGVQFSRVVRRLLLPCCGRRLLLFLLVLVVLFLALFIILEAVLIRKEDPDDWRHVFRIIYYGFGDARRYEYYQRPSKIRQVLLTRVRNLNTMSREEFDAMPAAELQRVVDDPVLVQFIFEDRRYKPDELVGIIKRIKAWGQTSEESDS